MASLNSLLLACFIAAHPLHVSFTNVEINRDKKIVTVSHKFYINDFSLLFYHLFEKNIEPQQDKAFSASEIQLINSYMGERFTLSNNTDTIGLKYLHKEQVDESIWLYYEGDLSNANFDSLTIENLLMLDLYEDQKNLVIITHGGKESGYEYDYTNLRSVLDIGEY
jgi:hypothetical protein